MPLADNALTTVDDINLSIETTKIESYINVASDIIEDYCNRKFKKQVHEEKYETGDFKYLTLNNYPIESIELVEIDNDLIEDYILLDNKGMIFRSNKWAGPEGPYIDVKYTAGYILPSNQTEEANMPKAIEQACILLVQNLHSESNKKLNLKSVSLPEIKESYFKNEGNLPKYIQALLSKHVRRLI